MKLVLLLLVSLISVYTTHIEINSFYDRDEELKKNLIKALIDHHEEISKTDQDSLILEEFAQSISRKKTFKTTIHNYRNSQYYGNI